MIRGFFVHGVRLFSLLPICYVLDATLLREYIDDGNANRVPHPASAVFPFASAGWLY